MNKTIVAVKYKSSKNPEQFGGRQFTYYSEIPLVEGDIVRVPVRDTDTLAQVVAINLGEETIAEFADSVKTVIEKVDQPTTTIEAEVIETSDSEADEPEDIQHTKDEMTNRSNELMVVRQLPVIEEQLRQVKEDITARVEQALSLNCTKDTYKSIKKQRSAMNNEFTAFEERRKTIKKAILKPYDDFNATYEECVARIYKDADAQLKQKIGAVEQELKDKKTNEVHTYFTECLQAAGIDFLTFEQTGITIDMTVSPKRLKEQVKAFIDKVSDELAFIDSQEHSTETLIEYKRTLNAVQAMTIVSNRHKAIEKEQQRAEAIRAAATAKTAVTEKVDAVLTERQEMSVTGQTSFYDSAPLPPPETLTEAKEVPMSKAYEASFKVLGTIEQLKAVKAFLVDGGYIFKSI